MVAIDFQVRHAWILEFLQYISLFPCQMPCKVTCYNVTMSQNVCNLNSVIRIVHGFYAVQICFADFAARMASTVGDDIHFQPKS